jgi:hypothetical protein
MALDLEPDLARLARTSVTVDAVEGFPEVVKWRVSGDDGTGAGLDSASQSGR